MKLVDMLVCVNISPELIDEALKIEGFSNIEAKVPAGFSDEDIIHSIFRERVSKKPPIRIENLTPSRDTSIKKDDIKGYVNEALYYEESLLSYILRQLEFLYKKHHDHAARKLCHDIRENIIDIYADDFVKKMMNSDYECGFGYELSYGTQFLDIKNGARPKGGDHSGERQARMRGWKFHLSVSDEGSDYNNTLRKILLPLLFKYQIYVTKIKRPIESKKDDLLEKPEHAGKQVTIYTNQSTEVEDWQNFFNELHVKLITSGLKPGYIPESSKTLKGSQYVSYRYDTFVGEKKGQRREGGPYMPEGITDPYEKLEITGIKQPRNKGKLNPAVQNNSPQLKPSSADSKKLTSAVSLSLDLNKLSTSKATSSTAASSSTKSRKAIKEKAASARNAKRGFLDSHSNPAAASSSRRTAGKKKKKKSKKKTGKFENPKVHKGGQMHFS